MPNQYPALQPLPEDLPSTHVDTLLVIAGKKVLAQTSPEEPIDAIIREALRSTHVVAVAIDFGDGVGIYGDNAWKIPAKRSLQFASFLRYAVSDDGEYDVGAEPTPSHWLGLADAWALRQGLFQDDPA